MSANDNGAQTPKSAAERQAAYRARQAAKNKSEVRGIYAHPEQHEKIKKYAAELIRGGAAGREPMQHAADVLVREIARLEAECAALKADADRYRWFGVALDTDEYDLIVKAMHTMIVPQSILSEWIDAAMQPGDKP